MPPTPYATIANQIAARLATVANIGRVHAFQRYLKSREQIDSEFIDSSLGRHNGWTISRESFPEHEQSCNLKNTRVSHYVLRGFMSVEDAQATELLFQQVIDDVCDAFRPQDNLSETVELIKPIKGRSIGYTWLGKPDSGIFCHGAELELQVQETYYSRIEE